MYFEFDFSKCVCVYVFINLFVNDMSEPHISPIKKVSRLFDGV